VGKTLPLHPDSTLNEEPAVVFIGKAGENQLPISLRENSCKSVGKTLSLHPNSPLNQKTRLDVESAKRKQQTA